MQNRTRLLWLPHVIVSCDAKTNEIVDLFREEIKRDLGEEVAGLFEPVPPTIEEIRRAAGSQKHLDFESKLRNLSFRTRDKIQKLFLIVLQSLGKETWKNFSDVVRELERSLHESVHLVSIGIVGEEITSPEYAEAIRERLVELQEGSKGRHYFFDCFCSNSKICPSSDLKKAVAALLRILLVSELPDLLESSDESARPTILVSDSGPSTAARSVCLIGVREVRFGGAYALAHLLLDAAVRKIFKQDSDSADVGTAEFNQEAVMPIFQQFEEELIKTANSLTARKEMFDLAKMDLLRHTRKAVVQMLSRALSTPDPGKRITIRTLVREIFPVISDAVRRNCETAARRLEEQLLRASQTTAERKRPSFLAWIKSLFARGKEGNSSQESLPCPSISRPENEIREIGCLLRGWLEEVKSILDQDVLKNLLTYKTESAGRMSHFREEEKIFCLEVEVTHLPAGDLSVVWQKHIDHLFTCFFENLFKLLEEGEGDRQRIIYELRTTLEGRARQLVAGEEGAIAREFLRIIPELSERVTDFLRDTPVSGWTHEANTGNRTINVWFGECCREAAQTITARWPGGSAPGREQYFVELQSGPPSIGILHVWFGIDPKQLRPYFQ